MRYTQVNNENNKVWSNNLKDILDQDNQPIDGDKSEHPTGTLVKTVHKPEGGGNTFLQFRYGPLTIFWHTQEQVSVSKNYYDINSNNRSTINNAKMNN